jgi:SH3-like domain-containing protein
VALLLIAAGCRHGKLVGEPAYVAAPQVNLRDRLSALYNKTGTVKNGERVEILEKSKRFVLVRSPRGEEGWMEARYLVGPEVAEAFAKLQKDNANTPIQAHGVTRAELNMHAVPGRETDHLYRMDDATKVEVLKRATAEKTQAAAVAAPAVAKASSKSENPEAQAPSLEDWLLVRDAQRHTGWVLARMVDIDVPLDVAQYAEGQRIVACFVLSQMPDVNPDTGEKRQAPQFLMVLNQTKDGTPWDFNQIRVFTWNSKRHHYETAYRERDLYGVFPVLVGHQVFDKEGDLPTFTINVQEGGSVVAKRYKLNQPIVRRVLTAGEQKQEEANRAVRRAEIRQQRAARHVAQSHKKPHKPVGR